MCSQEDAYTTRGLMDRESALLTIEHRLRTATTYRALVGAQGRSDQDWLLNVGSCAEWAALSAACETYARR